jgi:hypothetical protein
MVENGLDVTFFDMDHTKALEFAARHGGQARTRIPTSHKLYAICVPTKNHLTVTRDLFRLVTGATVVIEKPVGENLVQCQEILNNALASGNGVITTYQRRFDLTLRALSDLRKPLIVECYRDFEWLCHFYDMTTWYGAEIKLYHKKQKQRTVISINFKEVSRHMDNAYIIMYEEILTGKSRWLCSGHDILKPHLINEYDFSEKRRKAYTL